MCMVCLGLINSCVHFADEKQYTEFVMRTDQTTAVFNVRYKISEVSINRCVQFIFFIYSVSLS